MIYMVSNFLACVFVVTCKYCYFYDMRVCLLCFVSISNYLKTPFVRARPSATQASFDAGVLAPAPSSSTSFTDAGLSSSRLRRPAHRISAAIPMRQIGGAPCRRKPRLRAAFCNLSNERFLAPKLSIYQYVCLYPRQ